MLRRRRSARQLGKGARDPDTAPARHDTVERGEIQARAGIRHRRLRTLDGIAREGLVLGQALGVGMGSSFKYDVHPGPDLTFASLHAHSGRKGEGRCQRVAE